jgi:hypothetical protein
MFRRQRLVIVRRDADDLYRQLQQRFAGDPATVVLKDRRSQPERRVGGVGTAVERRRERRRYLESAAVLERRGYFVIRSLRSPTD